MRREARYVIKSWWPENNRYYVQKLWYYRNWSENSEPYSVVMAAASEWWGTWDECVEHLRKIGW